MVKERFEGLSDKEIIDQRKFRRDIRSLGEKIHSILGRWKTARLIFFVSLTVGFLYPSLFLICFGSVISFYLYYAFWGTTKRLPLKFPRFSLKLDRGAPLAGKNRFGRAAGIFYLGNELEKGLELWLDKKDMLTHCLVFGSTGSGKTQALVSMAYNSLICGSGLFYIDPKASMDLPLSIWQLARRLGREDDFRLINYTGLDNLSQNKGPPTKVSHTNNPFSFSSADAIIQLLGSLMPSTQGGNAIFADKALNLIAGIIYSLVDLRDKGLILLSAAVVREFLSAEKCVELVKSPNLNERARASLRAALLNCNWIESRDLDKQTSFFEQYGYAQSYFGRALSSLTDAYGHIYNQRRGEVDYRDLVVSRRLLVTLLPSMEKSPAELASLGKITLSAVKAAAAVGLGKAIEGDDKDIVGVLTANINSVGPFLSIIDEYAAIVTPGFEMLLTQGRSLGLATVIASQDYAGLIEADRKGTQQIVANTALKIFMKSDDPDQTYRLLKSLTGEAAVADASAFERKESAILGSSWRDNGAAAIRMKSRIEFLDLANQLEGEAHCVYKGRLFRSNVFYANPPLKDAVLRLPRLMTLDEEEADIESDLNSLADMEKDLDQGPAKETSQSCGDREGGG
ncbi:MAG: TraM recognition domain-containing protein [Deltaproteobacteria bacterium]|jgi:intracellular multiplication protein IcmO|nr:TraM recognition domain-containing protein [Deltaproteobacteria bacterium]